MQTNKPQKKKRFSSWEKITFIVLFFLITPVTVVTSFLSLSTLSNQSTDSKVLSASAESNTFERSGAQVYASLPSSFPSISGDVTAGNKKVGLLKTFLDENDSPLSYSAEKIVEVSEKYGLDYRLTTAIAKKESGLCRVIPEGSYNCWGWGIHSEGSLGFNSYDEGIEIVSKGLKEYYIDQGYETVEEIMTKYANPSSTTWAEGVLHYMSQIE